MPCGFVGESERPNGIQIFVKDDQWRSQYSTWENATRCGIFTIDFAPTVGGDDAAFTDPGFDPTRVRIIGIKFGIGDGSEAAFRGEFEVLEVNVDPPVALLPHPLEARTNPVQRFGTGDVIEVDAEGFRLNRRRWFVVGGNARLLEYGQTFGATAWFPWGNGIARHPNFVRAQLGFYRKAGAHVIRVGLVDDGRALLEDAGHVTGYNVFFRGDVETLLILALEADLKVEFAILDLLVAGKGEVVDRVLVRGRPALFTDPATRTEFVESFLVPFLNDFGDHPTVFGFDLLNEVEWLISKQEGGGWEDVKDLSSRAVQPIPRADIAAYATAAASAIREHAHSKMVTIGVSAPFRALAQDLGLDYIAVHHYPWMGALDLTQLPRGRPWSLEEFPTSTRDYELNGTMGLPASLSQYLGYALGHRGAGALAWNFTPGIDESTMDHEQFEARLGEMRDWCDAQPTCAPRTYNRALTLTVKKHLRARGSLVADGAAAECLASQTIKIQRRRKTGGWRTVKTLTTNAGGRFSSALKDRPGNYRAIAPRAEVPSSLATCGAAKSKTVRHKH